MRHRVAQALQLLVQLALTLLVQRCGDIGSPSVTGSNSRSKSSPSGTGVSARHLEWHSPLKRVAIGRIRLKSAAR